jgi:hypothetical protein
MSNLITEEPSAVISVFLIGSENLKFDTPGDRCQKRVAARRSGPGSSETPPEP